MKLFVRPLLLTLCLGATAQAATLEQLFETGRYAEFLSQAQQAAAAGDAEALFLLGKAHHTGKGARMDWTRAREFYEQARQLGYARASHNLASLHQRNDPDLAIQLYEEALARGLKMPTLHNLGVLASPSPLDSELAVADFVTRSGQAGDYFVQAYAESGQDMMLLKAAWQYLQALQAARRASGPEAGSLDLAALRARAIEWLEKGKALGLGDAWTHYGMLLLEEGKLVEARAALFVGAEKDVAMAHYQFAEMASKGLGGDQWDAQQVLPHYEHAALFGIKEAMYPARETILASLRGEDDEEVLREGVRRIIAMSWLGAELPDEVQRIIARLEWSRMLRRQQSVAGPLADLPLVLQACAGTQPSGGKTRWRLDAHHAQQPPRQLLEGHVDADGCARSAGPLSMTIRQSLEQGAILALKLPDRSLPLAMNEVEGRLLLEIEPDAPPVPAEPSRH